MNMAKERGAALIPQGEEDEEDLPSTAEEEVPPQVPSEDDAPPEPMDQ